MKSLILKDIYNIAHNSKSMLFMLVMFIFLFVPQSGVTNFIFISGILSSMMVITTFSFDDMAQWTKYAMIMPVTKKEVVLSKFIVLVIFSLTGVLTGGVLGTAASIFFHKFSPASMQDWKALAFSVGIGFVVASLFGSLVIPLLFKYGAEKARMMSIMAFLMPTLIFLGLSYLLGKAGIEITEKSQELIIFVGLPVVVLIVIVLMYVASVRIFEKKEL